MHVEYMCHAIIYAEYYIFIIQLIFLQQYFPIPVRCNITRYCTGVIARCALIRIDAFEQQATRYFVWEEIRRCSG